MNNPKFDSQQSQIMSPMKTNFSRNVSPRGSTVINEQDFQGGNYTPTAYNKIEKRQGRGDY